MKHKITVATIFDSTITITIKEIIIVRHYDDDD